MRATEILVCGACIILALLFTFGNASPSWRPQGRFGKRARVVPLPRVLETAGSDEGMVPNMIDVPTEVMLQNAVAKLCSDSRLADTPECSGMSMSSSSSSTSSSQSRRLKNLKSLADYLNL